MEEDEFERGSYLDDTAESELRRFTDDEEEDDDSEDEEPKLKFERLGNDFSKILDKDAVSCVAVHPKFLCVGSYRGQVYILDPLGNNVTLSPRKFYEAHKVAVNQISIDANGDFFASCSDDGKINVYSLCDGEKVLSLQLDRKIRCIAIDPQYSKGGLFRRFIIGDESVTVYERNIFSRLKPTVLLEGSSVTDLKWHDRFAAWSWRAEVRIYDMTDMMTISRVQFDSLRADKFLSYRCNLFWKDAYTIYIGWGSEVQICNVRRQEDPLKIDQGASNFYVQIINMFKTDFCISGLSSFGQYLTILCLDNPNQLDIHDRLMEESDTKNGNEGTMTADLQPLPQRPKVHIIQPDRLSYDIVYTHVLQTRGYQQYKLADYHFESLTDELLYFVVTPKDIILAKSRDLDDHIQWLMEHTKFEEALECASQNVRLLQRHTVLHIGRIYLEHLFHQKRYDEAGKLCLQIIAKDKPEEWEKQILRFSALGQLSAIAPFIPRNENYKLKRYLYELVLFEYLKKDVEAFLALVRDWAPPPTLYNVPTIINAVLDHLLVCAPDNRFLLQALADLYSYENKHGKALAMYLRLQDPHVFVLIQRHGLFREIMDSVEDLMALKTPEAISLFMKYKDKITPSVIVQKLQGNRYYLYQYLDALYRAEGKELLPKFHGQMVSLYADYGPDKLLQFLKSSDHYPIHEAMLICKKRQLYAEMIYLLTRMGNAKEALRLITHELEDINQAIEFCKEHDYRDLWDDLINFSLDKPNYIHVLLCNIGTHVDPQIIVRKIENGLEIPGLRDSLVKIMQDYSLQISLQEGFKNILVGDCLVLFEKLVKIQQHGVFLEEEQYCGSCQKRVIIPELHRADDIKVFYCKHVFHESCLSTFDTHNCIICNLTERRIGMLDKL